MYIKFSKNAPAPLKTKGTGQEGLTPSHLFPHSNAKSCI